MKKHIDLGCGSSPRNPFGAKKVYGIDIVKRDDLVEDNIFFEKSNLILESIPYENNTFDSVSAYDFFEHIPRVVVNNNETFFPFINLMNEIYRVLKDDGELYAITPIFPKESAFVDPTHVNFISKNTYKYFCEPDLWAKMYGYTGKFEIIRVQIVNFDYEVNQKNGLKKTIRSFLNFVYPKRKQHIVWHLKAIK